MLLWRIAVVIKIGHAVYLPCKIITKEKKVTGSEVDLLCQGTKTLVVHVQQA